MLVIFAGLSIVVARAVDDSFTEDLVVKPLNDGNVYAHFQFSNVWHVDASSNDAFRHFELFPKSIGQIIEKFDIDELHLTMSQGRWQYDKWGVPIVSAPIGSELWVWFRDGDPDEIDRRWIGLTNALSGISCASLQFMSATVTSVPAIAFAAAVSLDRKRALRRGVLPREMVCTENLTPWLKLLPCGDGGLARLLHPYRLYDGAHHTQATRVLRRCSDASCATQSIELVTSVSVVVPTRTQSEDWSLASIFARPLERCPLAMRSDVLVLLSNVDRAALADSLHATPTRWLNISRALGQVFDANVIAGAVYDLRGDALSADDIGQRGAVLNDAGNRRITDGGVSVQRVVTSDDTLLIELRRHADDADRRELVDVTYYDAPPWQMRLYLHTMRCAINDVDIALLADADRHSPLRALHLVPSVHKSTPSQLEFVVALRAGDRLACRIRFERAFMHWTAFAPDAHRGLDLGAASVEISRPACVDVFAWADRTLAAGAAPAVESDIDAPCVRRQYSLGVQLVLPTPDFSMPYNVICLSGTVWALFFGNMFNALMRRYSALRRGNEFVSDRPAARLFRFVRDKFLQWRASSSESKAKAE